MPKFGQKTEPRMSPSSRSIAGISLDLAALTPQQILAFAAALSLVVAVVFGAFIVSGWCFSRCSPSRRRDLTSLIAAIVDGLRGRENR